MRRERFSEEIENEIAGLFVSGEVRSASELAKIYLCSRLTIRNLLRKKQINTRNKAGVQTKIGGITEEDKARFWDKVSVRKDECWLWQASVLSNGYGRFKFREKTVLAHRFSWCLKFGSIPDGKFVLHKCDIRRCVNPAHLFIGTNQDNMTDRDNKGRCHHPTGETHPGSKLKEFEVLEIRRMIDQGLTHRSIAALFSVAHQTITSINTRRSWSHI